MCEGTFGPAHPESCECARCVLLSQNGQPPLTIRANPDAADDFYKRMGEALEAKQKQKQADAEPRKPPPLPSRALDYSGAGRAPILEHE